MYLVFWLLVRFRALYSLRAPCYGLSPHAVDFGPARRLKVSPKSCIFIELLVELY